MKVTPFTLSLIETLIGFSLTFRSEKLQMM